MNRNFFFLSAIFLLSLLCSANAQTASALKDSVRIGSDYYMLEELKLDMKDGLVAERIYRKIRNVPDTAGAPGERLQSKKTLLLALIADSTLRQANYGFEHYELLYDKKGLLNVSLTIQSYGSPFESGRHYCFDLSSGNEIGSDLFIGHSRLLKAIAMKLRQQKEGIRPGVEDLGEFAILTDGNRRVKEIRFFVADRGNYRNSGYELFEVNFSRKEIGPYLAPAFKRRLLDE